MLQSVIPDSFTDKFDIFYDLRGDNAVFDIDEDNRAVPPTPNMFTGFHEDTNTSNQADLTLSDPDEPSLGPIVTYELPIEPGFEVDGLDPEPYFDLEKLKLTIRDRLSG